MERAREWQSRIEWMELASGTRNAIKIYLSWDTDRNDVDLRVSTPSGERIDFQNRRGRGGEELYHDVTSGYGPESFSAPGASAGAYAVEVSYYGTSRTTFTEVTGEVTVILNEGAENEEVHVLPYRIDSPRQTVTVAQIQAT